MTQETLNKANAIAKTIDRLEIEQSKITSLFSKKEKLTQKELEEVFQIAMVNTSYTLKKFKEELNNL